MKESWCLFFFKGSLCVCVFLSVSVCVSVSLCLFRSVCVCVCVCILIPFSLLQISKMVNMSSPHLFMFKVSKAMYSGPAV